MDNIICSDDSVTSGRVVISIIGFLIESIVFCDRKIDSILKKIEWIDIFQRSTRANWSSRSLKKIENWWSDTIFRHKKGGNVKNIWTICFFSWWNQSFFVIERSIRSSKRSITVDFFKDRKDRKIEDRKIEDRIPNPALGRKDIICFCCVCSKLIMCL